MELFKVFLWLFLIADFTLILVIAGIIVTIMSIELGETFFPGKEPTTSPTIKEIKPRPKFKKAAMY